jgi:hypothetical protein
MRIGGRFIEQDLCPERQLQCIAHVKSPRLQTIIATDCDYEEMRRSSGGQIMGMYRLVCSGGQQRSDSLRFVKTCRGIAISA